ncbi:MAG: hypothetical protein KatS3mg126_1856 [Lysobacteraceae bacterium]|nr:MAG: hypothetical protein KatS3mg126_1856 [Xanthomonadaceae bacterium]
MAGDLLRGWQVVVLRPAAEASSLRRSLAHQGARLHCVAPWCIEWKRPAEVLASQALACPLWVVTSPNAVRGLARWLRPRPLPVRLLAVGAGTAARLLRAGLGRAIHPRAQQDSEGLLALPPLQRPAEVVLATGEGGRGLLERELQRRGAQVHRLEVYRRRPRPCPPARCAQLAALPGPRLVWVSSAEALAAAGPGFLATVRGWPAVVASARLAQAGQAAGLEVVAVAASARPAAMLDATLRHAKHRGFR